MTTQEETYKVTVHLIDGKRLKCHAPVTASELTNIYKLLADKTARIKFPTRSNVHQFMAASSVLRIEAKGVFL